MFEERKRKEGGGLSDGASMTRLRKRNTLEGETKKKERLLEATVDSGENAESGNEI